jgi:hypothetical protein
MDFHAFLQRQGRPSIAVTRFQLLPRKGKADVPIDELQQVSLWNLIFLAEAKEQRFGGLVLPHHDQQASDDENSHGTGRIAVGVSEN